MSLAEIEKAVKELTLEELTELAAYVTRQDKRGWDEQIEEDFSPGGTHAGGLQELDAVALTSDLPKHGLVRGDVGTAVLVHGGGAAFEVEFVGYDGHTVALLTLESGQVRSLDTHDIPHARELAQA